MFFHHMKRRYRKDRGLVLVLVVALCATMAILGSTFLFIARTDRRRNENVEYRFLANTAAQNVVAQVRALLKEDLHIGAVDPADLAGDKRPYGVIEIDNMAGVNAAKAATMFIDFPLERDYGGASYGADLYLASLEFEPGNEEWPALTNLTDHADTANYANVPIDHNKLRNVTGYRDPYSGEIIKEARLNPEGPLYIATRVVDLGGLINVNTSFQRDAVLDGPAGQAMMGLLNFFADARGTTVPANPESWAYWADFNAARCGGTYQDAEYVQTNLAESLEEPPEPPDDYMPYGINDEPALRWLGEAGDVLAGRLWDYTNLSPYWRKHLTTYSVSRSVTRYALGEYDNDTKYTRFELNKKYKKGEEGNFIDKSAGSTYRTVLFNQLAKAGMDRDEAAHFVANLWAYLHGQDYEKAYNFEYDSDGNGTDDKTVYGVLPQPFIVEAYIIVTANTLGATGNDSTWGYAIEVWNPYDREVEIYLGDESDSFEGGDKITLEADARKVFYGWGTGDDSSLTAPDIFINNDITDWEENDEVNFTNGKSVSIIRKGDKGPGSDPNIVLDTVSGGDLGFVDNPETAVEDMELNIRRDDDWSRHRYSIAIYGGIEEDVGNTLGEENNLSTSEIPYTECFGGFYIPVRGSSIKDSDELASINDLNELVRLFRTGPNDDGDSMTQQLAQFKTEVSRGRMDVLGTPASGSYPTVPYACLIGEFFDCIEAKGDYERYFGRLNINTATPIALEMLPWPTSGSINIAGVGKIAFDPTETPYDALVTPKEIVNALLDYRESDADVDRSPYISKSSREGFRTPGEIANVLAEYMEAKFTEAKRNFTGDPTADLEPIDRGQPSYFDARDMLYGYVSNLICTQSDIYAVYILIQTDDSDEPESQWRYLAVLDRSNCEDEDDTPTLLLFTRLK